MANNQLTQVLRRLRRLVTGAGGDATDQQLLERYAAHFDENAFAALVQRHGPLVHGVCRRVLGNCHDADDAFQATFLVLAKKAGTVVWRASIGNWLYSVAYRVASRARTQAARRSRHEQASADRRPVTPADHPEALELQQVLDEELIRLPERYRMPMLLCCLHDQTIDEAAQQLGWSFGMVKGRVQRGRELLRARLQRRGITLSAGVLAAIVTNSAGATLPPKVLSVTVQTITTGSVTEAVAALATGVLQAMFREKLMRAGLMVLMVSMIGTGLSVPVYRAWADKPSTEAAREPQREDPDQKLPAEVRGEKVLAIFGRDARPKDDEVRDALKKAEVRVVQQIDDDAKPGALRLVLDMAGKDPAKVLVSLPRFTGAIVFQDGKYVRGVAPEKPVAGYKQGQVPAPYAVGAASMPQFMPKILENYNKLPGVQAEHIVAEGFGVGYVKLTSKDNKTTLLDVFVRTKGDFNYINPPAAPAK